MFRKSRRRIVASIMAILVFLWAGTLGFIYASSYFEMASQNEEMLKIHAEMYMLSSQPNDTRPPNRPFPGGNPGFNSGFAQSPSFQLSTFYSVAFAQDGTVLEVENNSPSVHDDEELKALASEIFLGNKTSGTRKNLAFYKTDKKSYTLVAFKDNTIVNENAMTLFRYTLIFGGVALILFFFLSVFLARKIVAPLETSYRKQKQFISDAGHELKTPVSVVSANAEMLSREIGNNQWLSNIQYENERMGLLVGELLDLARTENVKPPMKRLDFSRLVAGEALPFESVAFEKGMRLNCHIGGNIDVMGNDARLKQLVSILLDNAIQHSGQQDEVQLILTAEHGAVSLRVINSGEEIPHEQQEQIFERFYRVDTARSGDDKHYGLGLAIAKAIVTAHKGRIGVCCHDGLVEFHVQLPTA